MKFKMKLLLGLFVYFCSNFQVSFGAANQCRALRNEPGLCVPFQQCPPLLAVLKSPSITGADINMLKGLTCDFENPKICCTYKDLVRTTSFNLQPTNTIPSTTSSTSTTTTTTTTEFDDLLVWSLSPDPTSLPTQQTIPPPPPAPVIQEQLPYRGTFPVGGSYASHPNFGLLAGIRECGTPGIEENITGGQDAAHAGHPWMVRIGYRNKETDEIEFYCAGTIISKRYIMTAAHCTEEIDSDYITEVVQAAEYNTTTNPDCSTVQGCSYATNYPIEKIVAHPGYNTDDKFNDIGIIRVSRDIEFNNFVKPICLPLKADYGIRQFPSRTNLPNRRGIVAGWGRTKWNRAEGSTVLQEVILPIVSNEECQAKYSSRTEISDKQMCAGGIKGKDSCGGDSGGPFILPLHVNLQSIGYVGLKFFQIGVVSYGPVQCGVGALPGVYSDVQSYLGWILDNIEP